MYNLRVFFVVDSFIEKSLQLTQNFMVVIGFDSKPIADCQTNKKPSLPCSSPDLLQDLQIKSIFGED